MMFLTDVLNTFIHNLSPMEYVYKVEFVNVFPVVADLSMSGSYIDIRLLT